MKKILLLLASSVSAFGQKKQNAPLTVGSFNLRYDTPNDGPDAWPHRKNMVRDLVRFHDFDVFGTQEGLHPQLIDLTAPGSGLAFTGSGRDDGGHKGEHSAIVYKTSRLRVLKSGDFWLSETPEKPGKGWDATCCNRICSWAQFQDLKTGKRFYFFSVHFDHQGVIARRESGKLMVQKINEIAGKQPVICVGDLNSTPETEQVAALKTLLRDSREASQTPPYGPVGTFNGFKMDAPLKDRIDYIFVSPGWAVGKYGVLTDHASGHWPSDHLPVLAVVE